ncbi:hypothetical protein PRIPAC_95384 [Pristionchus pacificus]|uniref:Uncharacterized protein n=1 Tax=Pristionchus pacificus TaxID=54126 RepID=A0A2A6CTZ5_PRIPA|nr:hypothetical protein PRIPAC_95384 [Pristionchus pacificus]|eukprot:PDM81655.1 hypothetical protein PRIPAC_30636 [Pristionchus pacificus]
MASIPYIDCDVDDLLPPPPAKLCREERETTRRDEHLEEDLPPPPIHIMYGPFTPNRSPPRMGVRMIKRRASVGVYPHGMKNSFPSSSSLHEAVNNGAHSQSIGRSQSIRVIPVCRIHPNLSSYHQAASGIWCDENGVDV